MINKTAETVGNQTSFAITRVTSQTVGGTVGGAAGAALAKLVDNMVNNGEISYQTLFSYFKEINSSFTEEDMELLWQEFKE